jgi:hypothetical protein
MKPPSPDPRAAPGFTLFEVMIAMTIFFIAIFSILELTSRNLKAAHSLRRIPPDIGSLAAELSLTNSLVEGVEFGDFGRAYPGFTWNREIRLAGTNGLFEVNFAVSWIEDRQVKQTRMSTYFYRPASASRSVR